MALNFKKMEEELDRVLANETKESLLAWLDKKRSEISEVCFEDIGKPISKKYNLQEIFNVLDDAKNELIFLTSNYEKHPAISIINNIRAIQRKYDNFSE